MRAETSLVWTVLRARTIGNQLMARVASAHQGDAASFTPFNLWVISPALYARTLTILGRPDEALKFSNEAMCRGRELKHPFSLAHAIVDALGLRWQLRGPEAARELAESLIAMAEEHGFREFTASGRCWRGRAMVELGQTEEGLAELEAIVDVATGIGPPARAILAYVCIRAGRADRALKLLDDELARRNQTGAHDIDAPLNRLKGEAILMRDSSATAEAEECFSSAIEIARGQSAKWFELRATISLARTLRDVGRRDEARVMLAEIYNWFTEGFDTADLKEAKALLDELSA